MKYELTDETIEVYGKKLHRIRALKDMGMDVKKGDLGGFVESERNLSQEGNCWIFDSAMVHGSAVVFGSAMVFDSAMVFGSAKVCGSATVCDSAKVYGSAMVFGLAKVYGSAMVFGLAVVCDEAEITKTTDIFTATPIGSRNGTTTFYKAKGGKIFVKCGCKNTDIDTWLGMVKETHGDNKHAQAYKLAAQIARLQILGEEE